jgi:RNA polymerase sigma factor (sigma-70 family)
VPSKELIRGCLKKDERSYYELYKECYGVLMSVCMRYFRNKEEAMPVLSETFYTITRNLDKYKEEVPWNNWIRRIAINTIINDYRRNKKTKEYLVPSDFSEGGTPSNNYAINEIEDKINADQIRNFVRMLPDDQLQVFSLYALDGYKHREISKMMKIPVGTSKWLLSQARHKLKEMISKYLERKVIGSE